jgi:hypothetical protein
VLGILQRVIAGWLADQAGIDRASAQCGAVTLIQRFGSALNLRTRIGADRDIHTRGAEPRRWPAIAPQKPAANRRRPKIRQKTPQDGDG